MVRESVKAGHEVIAGMVGIQYRSGSKNDRLSFVSSNYAALVRLLSPCCPIHHIKSGLSRGSGRRCPETILVDMFHRALSLA